jgi:hypothetical protein
MNIFSQTDNSEHSHQFDNYRELNQSIHSEECEQSETKISCNYLNKYNNISASKGIFNKQYNLVQSTEIIFNNG